MNAQAPSHSPWRWIAAAAALILVAVVAWNASARANQPPATQPMEPNIPGVDMTGGQASTATPIPSAPTMAPNMPGMDMDNNASPTTKPAEAEQGQSATALPAMDMGGSLMQDEPVASAGVPPATESQGGQPLPFQLDGDVKVFTLTAKPILWKINADTQVTAWSYNGTVPGPLIRVTEGEKVRIVFTNNLPDPTSIHWHGLQVPNNMDGVPPLTQETIKPGETFTYEFEARPTGTFMYHSHVDTDTQINIGLFGASSSTRRTGSRPSLMWMWS